MQRDLGSADIVNLVDLRVIDEYIAGVVIGRAGEQLKLRLDHMSQTMNVQQIGLGRIVYLPERGRQPHASAE